MKNILIIILVGLILLLALTGCTGKAGEDITGNFVSNTNDNPNKVTIYFFWGDGCPHCAAEKPFLESLKEKYGEDIEVKMFETYYNQGNQQIFQEVANAYGIQIQGVPTTFIGEEHWVGYADYIGKEIEDYVKYCIDNRCESPLETSYEDCDEEEDFCVVE